MTSRQRLAFIILQLNYGYSSWRDTVRLARAASLGDESAAAQTAATAVRASLRAADAAIATIDGRELVAA